MEVISSHFKKEMPLYGEARKFTFCIKIKKCVYIVLSKKGLRGTDAKIASSLKLI